MPGLKAGPLTRAELRAIWEGATDRGYREPLVAAGDGDGLEVWTQYFAQLERASRAVDVTTQALFIAPWSGQTSPPAGGGRKSTVTLSFARTGLLEKALHLSRGNVLVAEETTDWDEDGPVTVTSGRRYVLTEDLLFFPGEQGPFEVAAEAEFDGYGYDNPLPGTLRLVVQVGNRFENDLATTTFVEAVASAAPPFSIARVVTDDQADMFVPDHVGQYLLATAGDNEGLVAMATVFESPRPEDFVGSAVSLELLWTFSGVTFAGTFVTGEVVAFTHGGPVLAYGRVVAERLVGSQKRLGVVLLSGPGFDTGHVATGATSGATATVETVLSRTEVVAEAPVGGAGGMAWRMLDWVDDWGMTATNAPSPAGGRSPMLDALGAERAIYRGTGELDDSYRERVREVADVVAPNAIRRTVARTFVGSWELLEAGTTWRGFFYDGTNEPPAGSPHGAENDAYDTDAVTLSGSLVSIPYDFQELAAVESYDAVSDAWRFVARGFVGFVVGASVMLFVFRDGAFHFDPALGTLRVRGLRTGAIFDIASGSYGPGVTTKKYHTYLSYEQFRGFFWLIMADRAEGEFGFAYDAGSADAYDVGFMDGFPAGNPAVYGPVWQAVDRARAGGVGFEMKRLGQF